jgi:arylsulfatase A-like enzyme
LTGPCCPSPNRFARTFDRWPTRQGFDKFYGFLGGETDHRAPPIYDGVAPLVIPENSDYLFLTDMTDHSVGRVIHVIEQTGEMDNTLVIFVNETEFLTGANADAERQETALLPLFPPCLMSRPET